MPHLVASGSAPRCHKMWHLGEGGRLRGRRRGRALRRRTSRRGGRPIGVEDSGGQATVDEQRQLTGQQGRIGGTGAARQVGDPDPDQALVLDGAGMHVPGRIGLGGGVEERASVVAVPAGRARQRVEHADQLGTRILAGRLRRRAQLSEPDLVDPVQIGQHQVVLAREVLVQGRLGHVGLRDDGVHAYPAGAAGIEQAERGVEDPLACGARRRACRGVFLGHRSLPPCRP